MLRRLAQHQPDSFAYTPDNLAWADGQISKYPEGRQASAIIPLLWRAQEQEGWLSRPAIEHVCDMLGLAHIRGLEVATFYFMYQLSPVGSVAHIQVCGTTSCMICGAEDLIGVCKEKIAPKSHMLSEDGKFSWEEVECLGACANAPMAQIGKDYYEDLTTQNFALILDKIAEGHIPQPGPQNGRYAAEPKGGLTSLKAWEKPHDPLNASAGLARDIGDTLKRIDGTEVPLLTPWHDVAVMERPAPAKPASVAAPVADVAQSRPEALDKARDGGADDLKMIKGVGPAMEALLNRLGFYHFDQISGWNAEEVAWVDDNLEGFKGRVSRDAWVAQAKLLATGSETEFSQRAKKGDIYDT
ncbi:MAG: NADH-quinone oxidoreductase subunit E [Dinoroseobacter sp.]|jgi:NADH-quinone oxidoreductase subunit E